MIEAAAIFGPLGVVSMLLLYALAVVVVRARPHGEGNRRLALVLVLEASAGGFALGLMYLTSNVEVARVLQIVGYGASVALPVAYLWFLSLLDTSVVSGLRRPGVIPLVLGATIAIEAVLLTSSDLFLGDPVVRWYADVEFEGGPWGQGALLANAIVSVFGLVAGVSAYRRAPEGTAARRRAKMLAVAFGTRDAFFVPLFTLFGVAAPVLGERHALDVVVLQGPLVVTLLFSMLLSYGILRAQLFDIDLKIKVGLSRGFVGACFVLAFLVVSRVAANYLNQAGAIAGGVAVGVMMFGMAPIQKAAEHFADRALPSVNNSTEYLAFKKLEVYQAAVESAVNTNQIEGSGRAFLDELARRLSLDPQAAAAIERDVLAARSPSPLPA